MKKRPTVACPRCQAPVEWGPQSPFRPFCSERCKMVDLGDWALEKYRVPGTEDPPDEDGGANPGP
jgi:endogenous inhibitor of DNA gyrase (YacG/DUF329 family)